MDQETRQQAETQITTDELFRHTIQLSSPEFEGRFPGTIGEKKTLEYLKSEFLKLGAEGPLEGGSFFQKADFLQTSPVVRSDLKISANTTSHVFNQDEFAAISHLESYTLSNSPIVFVGFGINAPERGWNDYKDLDVKGKTVLAFVNDPGYYDEKLFQGKSSMTYYGRWTYKYEEAARQGAQAVFLIHTDGAAGYPFSVVASGKKGHILMLKNTERKCEIEGWFTTETSTLILRELGFQDFESAINAALKQDFNVTKNKTVVIESLSTSCTTRELQSSNFLALLRGSGDLANEVIVYSGHWDHFGKRTVTNEIETSDGKKLVEQTEIIAGARDNALSVSALVALAKAHKRAVEIETCGEKRLNRRSVLLFAATAEEQGLLGAEYYCQVAGNRKLDAGFDLAQTAGILNMDILNIFGKTKDITFFGSEQTPIRKLAQEVALKEQKRNTTQIESENGMFFRSDHFRFALRGVPALFINYGFEHIMNGRTWMLQKSDAWTTTQYHTCRDIVELEGENAWNLEGAVEDVRLLFRIGCHLLYKEN